MIRIPDSRQCPRINHPAFSLKSRGVAATRHARPGEIISDGVAKYLVLSDDRICSLVDKPWLVFKVPALGLYEIVGGHPEEMSKQLAAKQELAGRIITAVPNILRDMELGDSYQQRVFFTRLKHIVDQ